MSSFQGNTRVKICGITRVEDAVAAASAGADAIGIVFYPPSPRNVSDLGLAREIAQAAGPFTTVTGLFVNSEPKEVDEIVSRVPLQLAQFHGEESPDYCDRYSLPYIKAIRVRDDTDVSAQASVYSSAAGILLDAWVKGKPGGTGECFNWQQVPATFSLPFILAGGLNPNNVAAAVTQVKPYAVDVSGGVEQAPGVKDHQKISAFINNAKALETK